MARVVICPSCQSKGSVPDGSPAAKIRCPKCGQTFDVKAASQSQSSSGTAKRPASGTVPKRRPRPRTRHSTDLESVQPLPPLNQSGTRRSAAAGPQVPKSGQSPLLYAVLGVGGVALVAIIALVVVLDAAAAVPHQRAGAVSGAGRCSIAQAGGARGRAGSSVAGCDVVVREHVVIVIELRASITRKSSAGSRTRRFTSR